MRIQLSAGQGPLECQLGVGKLFEGLSKEFKDIKKISENKGKQKGCYNSITFETNEDLSFLEGSILWIHESTFRPNHKRKNWFVDVSVLDINVNIIQDINNEKDYKIETMHSGGKGGQNVNKVETGVRVTHIPTGLVVTCTEERNQLQNKRKAIERIENKLKEMQDKATAREIKDAWSEHYKIERGNPVRIYKGKEFKLVKG